MNILRPRNLLNFLKHGKFGDLGNYVTVMPHETTPLRLVPESIVKPEYYSSGEPQSGPMFPDIKTTEQIKLMKESCQLASSILKKVKNVIKQGVTTDSIDEFVHNECISAGAYPSPLNYRGFPKSICTSVNNVAVHGIPDLRPLLDGDIINVDITVYFKGYHGDCSEMFTVGNVDEQGRELIDVAKECLNKGISICGPGVPFREIGWIIQKHAEQRGYKSIPSCLGHGIGEYFHGPPDIYHTDNMYPGTMEPGMTFTIEPSITKGSTFVEILEDGWTVLTEDNSRSAQAEHTILVTDNGVAILTK